MEYSHAELTSSIIEAAIEVQRELGCGFGKDVYKRALNAELARENFESDIDTDLPLFYKGDSVGERRMDLCVEGVVCVELGVQQDLSSIDIDHTLKYLRASGLEAGLLLNFGTCSLEYIRLYSRACRSDILIGSTMPVNRGFTLPNKKAPRRTFRFLAGS